MASVNGLPGLLLARGDEIVAVLTADVRDGLLSNVWVVCNPDKLRHWNG
jgi:RNA polymerase sigma-70 factor (ECF subfamily)